MNKKTSKTIFACMLTAMLAAAPGHLQGQSHEGTATWPFDKGSENNTSAELEDHGKVSATSFELGSNLTLTEPAGAGTETLSKLQPVVKVGTSGEKQRENLKSKISNF